MVNEYCVKKHANIVNDFDINSCNAIYGGKYERNSILNHPKRDFW